MKKRTRAKPTPPPPQDAALEVRCLEALTSVAGSISYCADLDSVLEVAVDATLRALDLTVGGIYLIDEETGDLQATSHHRGVPPEYEKAVTRFERHEPPLGPCLDGDAPMVVEDLASMPEVREATRRLGLRSFVFVPLSAHGTAVGVLAVGGYRIRSFGGEELRLLEAMGGMLGGAVEGARLLGSTQRHLAQVQALWKIDRAMAEGRDLKEILGIIAGEAGVLGGGDSVIALVEGERRLRIAGSWGHDALRALGEPPSLAGTSVATLLLAPEPQALRLEGGDEPRRAFVVPLRSGEGTTLGGLVVVKPERASRGDDLTLLATFGHQAAVAIAKAQDRDDAGRRAGQLALVSGASEIAATTIDLDVLLGSLVRYIQRAFGYHSVSIYLVEEESREAVMAGAVGAAATVMPRNHRLSFGTGIIGWVAEHGEHVLANDVRLEPRFIRAGMEKTRAELAMPVRLAGEVVAVLNVESDRVGAFDDGDVLALDGIASQVASAIRNARLFEEKIRALRNLEILQEITNVLNTDLELSALLDRIARRSVEAVRQAQMGAVLLYDGESLVVRSSFGYANPEPLARLRMAFHEGLPGSVFVSGQGRVGPAEGSFSLPEAFKEAGGAGARGTLCVPISLPHQKLGVLLLESLRAPGDFDSEDLRFVATLADQAAIAMGNALRMSRILELDRQRQDYLSNVSHELRTPLTVIQGYLGALAEGTAGDRAGEFLAVALDRCQRLGRMIDEILEVSRFEQGVAQRHIEWGPVSVAHALQKVVLAVRHEVVLKRMTLTERIDSDVPTIAADERLIELLALNLLENAVKYTPEGGQIVLELRGDTDHVVLSVTDSGPGIPPEYAERVFEKFFMVDAGPARTHGGAGIGLYLAREVVLIHSGSIRVLTPAGGGSRFEARLPVRPTR